MIQKIVVMNRYAAFKLMVRWIDSGWIGLQLPTTNNYQADECGNYPVVIVSLNL